MGIVIQNLLRKKRRLVLSVVFGVLRGERRWWVKTSSDGDGEKEESFVRDEFGEGGKSVSKPEVESSNGLRETNIIAPQITRVGRKIVVFQNTRKIRIVKLSYSRLVLSYNGLWVEYVNVGDGNVMRRGSYSELSVLVMLNEIDR